jgi:pimeloyl-ACP methyl ester carboxylesterase
MGGKVSQLLAARKPKGLEAMVLVVPASPFPQHIPEEATQAQIYDYDNRDTALAAVQLLTARPLYQETTEQLIEDSLRGFPARKQPWPASAAYQDISDEVSKITVPTLVVVGDRDP